MEFIFRGGGQIIPVLCITLILPILLIFHIVLLLSHNICIFFTNATDSPFTLQITNPSDTPHNTGSLHSIINSHTHFFIIDIV